MKSSLTPTAILFAAVVLTAVSPAYPRDLQLLKDEYHGHQRELRAAWNASQDALRQDHKSSVAALNEAKRIAARLCEPQRSLELERIRGARQEAAESHRCSLDAARAEFRAARLRLEASYAVAASRLRTNTVYDATDAFQVEQPAEVFDGRLPSDSWRLSPMAEPREGRSPAEQAPYFGAPGDDATESQGPILERPVERLPTPAPPRLEVGSMRSESSVDQLREMLRLALADVGQ